MMSLLRGIKDLLPAAVGSAEVTENGGCGDGGIRSYGDVTPEELNRMKWASWSNDRSFWVQKDYPLQLLSDLGFDLVLEQFDCDKDIVGQWTTTGWRKTNSRVLLAGIKSTAQT